MKIIDLSHTISDGLVTFEGAPEAKIGEYLTREQSKPHYSEGTSFQISRIEIAGPTGTYMDSPYHRYDGAIDVAGLPLESLVNLEGVVVECMDKKSIAAKDIQGIDLYGKAVLIRTGWSDHWGSEAYYSGFPFLTESAAGLLADSKAALVGVDTVNVDDITDGRRPAHTILLGAGIPIIEHMTGLDRLPHTGFRFFAAPVKLREVGSTPVRAYAILQA